MRFLKCSMRDWEKCTKTKLQPAKKTPSSQMTPNFVREETKAKKSTNSDDQPNSDCKAEHKGVALEAMARVPGPR